MTDDHLFDNADFIHKYTRKQAFEDGVLVDVSEAAREAGYRYPVALTAAVWSEYVQVPEGVEAQDEQGRLWDLLWILKLSIQQSQGEQELLFQLYVRNNNEETELVKLKAICGPDDNGEPCLTILLPHED